MLMNHKATDIWLLAGRPGNLPTLIYANSLHKTVVCIMIELI